MNRNKKACCLPETGFEPACGRAQRVLKTRAFDRSATPATTPTRHPTKNPGFLSMPAVPEFWSKTAAPFAWTQRFGAALRAGRAVQCAAGMADG